MTVPSTTNKSGPYSLNGVTTQFSFNFAITQTSDVKVYITDTDGNTNKLSSGYQVVLNDPSDPSGGGYVSYPYPLVTAANGGQITLYRELTPNQTTDLKNRGTNIASVFEAMIDKVTMIVQEISEKVGRAPLADVTQSSNALTYPSPSAGKAIVWNAGGTGFVNQDLTASANNFATQIISTVPTGSAPISVQSTTLCPNLHVANADVAATATMANATKFDTSFPVTGSVIWYPSTGDTVIGYIKVAIPAAKSLVLKRARYGSLGASTRFHITSGGSTKWTSSDSSNDVTPGTTLSSASGTTVDVTIFSNVPSTALPLCDTYCFYLSIE